MRKILHWTRGERILVFIGLICAVLLVGPLLLPGSGGVTVMHLIDERVRTERSSAEIRLSCGIENPDDLTAAMICGATSSKSRVSVVRDNKANRDNLLRNLGLFGGVVLLLTGAWILFIRRVQIHAD